MIKPIPHHQITTTNTTQPSSPVELEEGEDTCPDSFYKCGDKPLCVGTSPEIFTWSEAVDHAPRDRSRLLQTRSVL